MVRSTGQGVGDRGRGKKGGEDVVSVMERGREGGGETRERKVEQGEEAEKGWGAGVC